MDRRAWRATVHRVAKESDKSEYMHASPHTQLMSLLMHLISSQIILLRIISMFGKIWILLFQELHSFLIGFETEGFSPSLFLFKESTLYEMRLKQIWI